MRKIVLFSIIVLTITVLPSCKSRFYMVKAKFNTIPTPAAPDYSKTDNWFALPGRNDMADRVMGQKDDVYNNEDTLKADVFFIYPTIFTGKANDDYLWNANIADDKLNSRITNTTIKYQSTAFNNAGRMFIPKYRQAQLTAYFTRSAEDGIAALDTAYTDVKRAFLYYMKNYNNRRPIIIASHSQGTSHAERLVAEFFDGKPLQKQLVAAYLVGMPINKNRYTTIKPCSTPTETGCYCSWTTFQRNYYPKTYYCRGYADAACVNPISWTFDNTAMTRKQNAGGLFYNYKKIAEHCSDAQVKGGILWIRHPHFPFSFMIYMTNYHVGDINLFYNDVRNNAILRVNEFLKK